MFVSYTFIAFLVISTAIYYIVPKRCQWVVLLVSNFAFYYAAGHTFPLYIAVMGLPVYAAALCIDRFAVGSDRKKNKRKKKAVLTGCLILNIGILATLKYADFVLNKNIIVPMGISFYTFQAVGYLLDVYWGRCKPQKNAFRFLLFVSFFPQLVQGPISRYRHMSESLYAEHSFDTWRIKSGVLRILWGYFKKLAVADRIGVPVMAMVSEPGEYQGVYVLIYMLFYAVWLYADFTGGIDITIGIAECLGVSLQENFERPFFSKNIAEYWRRWHISMGTWFRDYVFYPCSMSRSVKCITSISKKRLGRRASGRIAVYISTMIAWFATGVWHGMAWSYVAWGLVNGFVILVSGEFEPLYKKFRNAFPKLVNTFGFRIFRILRTFGLMCCIRMFDNYNSVRTSIRQFVSLFTVHNYGEFRFGLLKELGLSYREYAIVLVGVVAMFMVSYIGRGSSVRKNILSKPCLIRYAVFVLLLFAVLLFGAYGVGYDESQFIYNQF